MPYKDELPFEVSQAAWLDEARRLFGDDPKLWTFECPICGHRQTLVQFEEIGADPYLAYQECIGRRLTDRASELGAKPASDGRLSPCDYAAYGLFRALNGHLVIPEAGRLVPVLPFATPTQKAAA